MYKLTDYDVIIRLADEAYIPICVGNRDYDEYLLWLQAGNTPEPADVIAQVYTCSPWQIRKALNAIGERQTVESAVASSSDITLKDGWEFATQFVSNDPFVIMMGAVIGKNEDETAEFINYASTL